MTRSALMRFFRRMGDSSSLVFRKVREIIPPPFPTRLASSTTHSTPASALGSTMDSKSRDHFLTPLYEYKLPVHCLAKKLCQVLFSVANVRFRFGPLLTKGLPVAVNFRIPACGPAGPMWHQAASFACPTRHFKTWGFPSQFINRPSGPARARRFPSR